MVRLRRRPQPRTRHAVWNRRRRTWRFNGSPNVAVCCEHTNDSAPHADGLQLTANPPASTSVFGAVAPSPFSLPLVRQSGGSIRQLMTVPVSNSLCPSQQRAFDWCIATLPAGNIFRLWSKTGRGRTTVLRRLHEKLGGT